MTLLEKSVFYHNGKLQFRTWRRAALKPRLIFKLVML